MSDDDIKDKKTKASSDTDDIVSEDDAAAMEVVVKPTSKSLVQRKMLGIKTKTEAAATTRANKEMRSSARTPKKARTPQVKRKLVPDEHNWIEEEDPELDLDFVVTELFFYSGTHHKNYGLLDVREIMEAYTDFFSENSNDPERWIEYFTPDGVRKHKIASEITNRYWGVLNPTTRIQETKPYKSERFIAFFEANKESGLINPTVSKIVENKSQKVSHVPKNSINENQDVPIETVRSQFLAQTLTNYTTFFTSQNSSQVVAALMFKLLECVDDPSTTHLEVKNKLEVSARKVLTGRGQKVWKKTIALPKELRKNFVGALQEAEGRKRSRYHKDEKNRPSIGIQQELKRTKLMDKLPSNCIPELITRKMNEAKEKYEQEMVAYAKWAKDLDEADALCELVEDCLKARSEAFKLSVQAVGFEATLHRDMELSKGFAKPESNEEAEMNRFLPTVAGPSTSTRVPKINIVPNGSQLSQTEKTRTTALGKNCVDGRKEGLDEATKKNRVSVKTSGSINDLSFPAISTAKQALPDDDVKELTIQTEKTRTALGKDPVAGKMAEPDLNLGIDKSCDTKKAASEIPVREQAPPDEVKSSQVKALTISQTEKTRTTASGKDPVEGRKEKQDLNLVIDKTSGEKNDVSEIGTQEKASLIEDVVALPKNPQNHAVDESNATINVSIPHFGQAFQLPLTGQLKKIGTESVMSQVTATDLGIDPVSDDEDQQISTLLLRNNSSLLTDPLEDIDVTLFESQSDKEFKIDQLNDGAELATKADPKTVDDASAPPKDVLQGLTDEQIQQINKYHAERKARKLKRQEKRAKKERRQERRKNQKNGLDGKKDGEPDLDGIKDLFDSDNESGGEM